MLSDIKLLLLGEKLYSSLWSYGDFYTEIGPLTAYSSTILYSIFGQTVVPYHIVSLLLIAHQCYLINSLVNTNRATNDQTYIPGFLYGLLMSLSPEFYTLSPVLLSQGLLLIVINYQFNHLEFRVKKDEKILVIGIFTGLLVLFLPEAIIALLTVYLIFILFTNTIGRRYIIVLIGFFIPFILLITYFTFTVELPHLNTLFANLGSSILLPFAPSLRVAIIPGVFLLFALVTIARKGRFTNYQSRLVQSMILWLITAGLIFYFSHSGWIIYLTILIPPSAFFLTHYFLLIKKRTVASFMFYIFTSLIVTCNLLTWNKPGGFEFFLSENLSTTYPFEEKVHGKKTLVLSNDISVYKGARHATSFFSWDKSKVIFEGELTFEKIAAVYEGFKKDMPEIIYDPNNLLLKYLERIPEYKAIYTFNERDKMWYLNN